jgi:alpha-tubulin suppressor-like RCC1 family protein
MPPTISAPTANATISKIVGDTVTFTVTASGTGTLTYQWYKGSSAVGTNSSSLPIKPIAFTDSGVYTCAVSNGCGSVTSKVITLTVSSLPSITTQPLSQILYLNQTATFTVVAIGVPQPTYRWEKNGADINGATNASYTISSPGISDSGKYTVAVTNNKGTVISDTARFYAKVKIMSAGTSSDNPFSLFVKTDGTIWACGDNTFGQFGDGTTNSQITPVQIKSITNIQNVAAGATHSLFLKYDGMVWACGNNGSGQLGDGTTTSRTVSVQMINISNVLSIAAGGDHSLILKKDGTVWTCGNNSYGQLGDGTTINHSTPVQVTSIINVQSVAAGTFQCLMLKVDGTLWTCGYNYYGSIGDGTTIDRYFPVQVTTLGNNVKAMSASGAFSLILKNDGTLWTCGYNYCGELGDGTNSDRSTPGQITTISNVQSISAGEQHSLILKADATLWACGSNYYGELGDGSMSNKNTPIQIANMNNVQSIAAGEFHSLILKTDGTVWACGNNSNGQLGDGSTTNRSTPIRISF